ncbi:MAG: hypothetical protein V8T40_14495 [Phocaeicola vulgatus]|jgi:hypothetical protein
MTPTETTSASMPTASPKDKDILKKDQDVFKKDGGLLKKARHLF